MPKTVDKPRPATPRPGPTAEDLRTAHQVHTLAQMLYGHLAAAQPWYTPGPHLGPTGAFDPMTGPTPVPWAQGWPIGYGAPYGGVGPAGFCWPGPAGYFGSEFFPRW